MKTIEINTTTAIVFALFIAGIASILPSFFNIAGWISAIVYVITATVIIRTYKNKIWYKFNDRE